ncbi:vWA domain-containing protein [Nocardioides sambongensis]|uniref:vWA domain-containing protein n=1 Tax=Nocardioides sambongensis TaxID=2589074 RepID=UPI00112E348C|nr:VWA domain-containing protein [Nocardioides sambongensis]
MSDRLGGAVARRPLHFIFVLDVSGSMNRGGRIQALNNAITEVLPQLRDEARANPHAELLVRVLAFATEPHWVIEEPTPVERVRWERLDAVPRGFTELGSALTTLTRALEQLDEGAGAYPPAIILVSDGRPTQATGVSFADGLQTLLDNRWGAGAVRLALGVGQDADMQALRGFIGDPDVPLLRADNPAQLVDYIVWASKAASKVASRPAVGPGAGLGRPPEAPAGEPIWSPEG